MHLVTSYSCADVQFLLDNFHILVILLAAQTVKTEKILDRQYY